MSINLFIIYFSINVITSLLQNFHRRRAAYDLILANASAVYGRFSGISGSEIQDIDTINQNEKELKSNVELLRGIGNI